MPIPVSRALKKLGQDLRDARRRRRIPVKLAAERAGISRSTLSKIERGEGGVALSAYAKVLFVLGLVQRLADLAEPKSDELGITLQTEELPKRIRIARKKE